jgi:hypothetical protein
VDTPDLVEQPRTATRAVALGARTPGETKKPLGWASMKFPWAAITTADIHGE